MGPYSYNLNKGLLPIDKRAILTHIIERFPEGTHFVLAVGHLAQQVQDYVAIAHPDINVSFVTVDNASGPGSGPGYSLLCCESLLRTPFYIVACDTLWESQLDFSSSRDWIGVAEVKPEVSAKYCNLRITADNKILSIHDKQAVHGPEYRAFIGLCFVQQHQLFWDSLRQKTLVKGEHQISNGLAALVKSGQAEARHIEWTDVGDKDRYEAEVRRYEEYDFAKENEALYIVKDKVIKFFVDPQVTQNRVARALLNPEVFPKVEAVQGGFYRYSYQPGKTLYQCCTPKLFEQLLGWLTEKLWQPRPQSAQQFAGLCHTFYREKTYARLDAFHRKYDLQPREYRVNGTLVPALDTLLQCVPWDQLCQGVPVFFHGDLQFDNILYNEQEQRFLLLDWRQDFAGVREYGDLYYDLAKLLGGIKLNYDYIKRNLLSFIVDDGDIYIDFGCRFQQAAYERVLERYIRQRGLDFARVRLLVALIYLNMAPLHHFPFDRLLYHLGSLALQEQLERMGRLDGVGARVPNR